MSTNSLILLPPEGVIYFPRSWVLTGLRKSLLMNTVWKWKKKLVILQCRNLADTTVTKWSPVISWLVHADIMYPWYDAMRRTLHLCGILKTPQPQSDHEKTLDKLKLRDILENIWPVFFKSVKFMKHKERLRTHQRLEETKEIWWLNAV